MARAGRVFRAAKVHLAGRVQAVDLLRGQVNRVAMHLMLWTDQTRDPRRCFLPAYRFHLVAFAAWSSGSATISPRKEEVKQGWCGQGNPVTRRPGSHQFVF